VDEQTKPVVNDKRQVKFGTQPGRVIIAFEPAPIGKAITLTPHQAREWAKLLKRMATLAERLPDRPKEDNHGSLPSR
jgi:triosephosphate isomerase